MKLWLSSVVIATILLSISWVSTLPVHADEVIVETEEAELLPGRFAVPEDDTVVFENGYRTTHVTRKHSYGDAGGLVHSDRLAPGRYRADFEVGAEPFTGLPNLVAEVVVSGKHKFHTRITAVDFPADDFITVSVPFTVKPGSFKNVSAKITWTGYSDLALLRLRRVKIVRTGGPVFVASVRPNKLLYRPGESGTVRATIVNGQKRPVQLMVVLNEQTLLDDTAELSRRQVSIDACQTLELDIPYRAPTTEWGRAIRVSLERDGKLIDAAEDFASVSSNLWNVSLGHINNGILHNTGPAKDEHVDQLVERCREHYSNWIEKSFWAPDDWGELTPDKEEWISGQAARYENKKRMQLLIQRCKDQGIRSITYGKGLAGGTAGLELARKYPDWFIKSPQGVPIGRQPNVWDVDHWDDIEFHRANHQQFKTNWFYRVPDLRRIEILDHGIDELINSAEMFGWDGVRFDGHFTAGNDAMSTRNMQRMKRRLLEAHPDFVFGYNISGPEIFLGQIPHEIREAAAGGGHWMNEAIGQWNYAVSRRFTSWRHFAELENENAQTVRDLGGSYQYIYRLYNATAIQALYKFVIGTAIGARPVYGGHVYATGCDNWGRFLTRFSRLVWSPRLRNITKEATGVNIKADRPAWDFISKELVLDAQRKLMIVHLINQPPSDEIHVEKPQVIEPVKVDATIGISSDQTLAGVWWISPQRTDALKVEPDASGRVTLPALHHWGMLVLDLHGRFDVPPDLPAFTDPPDTDQVAAAMQSVGAVSSADPIRPSENKNTDPSDGLLQQVEFMSWSAKQTPRKDAAAMNGLAASFDHSMGSGTIHAHYTGLSAGRYRAIARIRVEGLTKRAHLAFYVAGQRKKYVQRGIRSQELGQTYREYEVEFIHLGDESFSVFIQSAAQPGEVFLCDWVKLQLIEPLHDAQVTRQLNVPTDQPVKVGPQNKTLVMRGLYHRFFRIDQVLRAASPKTEIRHVTPRDAPSKADDLSGYGTIVMANYQDTSLELRIAVHNFVSTGGHLIVFGGPNTLSQAKWKNTFLEELMPATFTTAPDIRRLSAGSKLGPTRKRSFPGNPMIFYAHKVIPRSKARVLWWAGKEPILIQHTFDAGRVTLFAGCPLGEAPNGHAAFWEWERWADEFAKTLNFRKK